MTVPNLMKPGGGRSRALVRSLALGLLLGLGGVGAGTTLVQAADDAGVLDFLLGEVPRSLGLPARAPRPQAALRERRIRWTSRPATVAVDAPRWVTPVHRPQASLPRSASPQAPQRPRLRLAVERTETPGGVAGSHDRTVCVRTCDGYMFPLANLEGRDALPAHQEACQAACPRPDRPLHVARRPGARPGGQPRRPPLPQPRGGLHLPDAPGAELRLPARRGRLRPAAPARRHPPPGDAVAAGPGPRPSARRSSPAATAPGRRASSSSAAPAPSRPRRDATSTAPST